MYCMGFDIASLDVEEAVAPRMHGWQMVKPRDSYSRRERDVLLRNHPRDQQSSNRYSPLLSSLCPSGLCHPVKEKDEDGDIVVGETMEVNVIDDKKNTGKITIDSGAAEKRASTRLPHWNSSTALSRITARSLLHRSQRDQDGESGPEARRLRGRERR